MDFDLVAIGLPGCVLLAVAAHHRWRVCRYGQWSWKGGGFAMFSDTTDNTPITEVWTEEADGRTSCLLISGSTHPRLRRAKVIPTRRHMMAWAREVADSSWQRCGSLAHARHPYLGSPVSIQRIVVRDRRVTFDGATGAYRGVDRCSYEIVLQGRQRAERSST